jgi:diguanylate cyclase (GGDEF)-like protein
MRLKEAQELAMVDPLTKLANRRYVEREMDKRFHELERYATPFGIIFIDIDHFKHLNDTYGHGVGDTFLKVVASSLSNNARPFDLFGRWGGEEFVGIFPNVDESNLKTIGERYRLLVENSYVKHDENLLSVTVSIGGTLATKTDDGASLIARADKAMYASKEAGRNRVTLN